MKRLAILVMTSAVIAGCSQIDRKETCARFSAGQSNMKETKILLNLHSKTDIHQIRKFCDYYGRQG